MGPMISIAALIYASPRYAAHFWDMLRRTTPELETGEADFRFVANDPTDEVRAYLLEQAIPHVVQENPRLTEAELVALGIGAPEYIRRVYQGWNRAVREARADCLVLLNSDHIMRRGWLAALRARWNPQIALSALAIEPCGVHGIFDPETGGGTGAVEGNYGRTLDEFNAEAFRLRARELEQDRLTPGGVFMPVMLSRDAVINAGMFPEGNLHDGTFQEIREYGDRHLFRVLAWLGVVHQTFHGVVSYHFHEGEMREAAAATGAT